MRAPGNPAGFKGDLSEERQRESEKTKMAENNAWREELPRDRPEEENSSREDTMDSERSSGPKKRESPEPSGARESSCQRS